jgi:nicotinate-nucleotide pyrophosphorylase (carboxylating)
MGLYDMVLVKENHIIAAGSIGAAIRWARESAPGVLVEIEVESPDEFREALDLKPDVIMLDEFTLVDMRAAVATRNAAHSATRLEASGGINIGNVREFAATGVDYISVGALTKHVNAIDLSLRFAPDV